METSLVTRDNNNNNNNNEEEEEETQTQENLNNRGGWVTFPFIIATIGGLTLATQGWLSNLVVYMIKEFNVKSIEAAQISNIFNGCASFFPILAAVLADSYLGSYYVILASTFISLLGILCLLLISTIDTLRPNHRHCENGETLCTTTPTKLQETILYLGLTLAALGLGGSRFTLGTMGANQFSNPKHQETYFNWYFFTMYSGFVVATTAVVYIEDNVSWGLGFGVCMASNLLALAIFLGGSRYYSHVNNNNNNNNKAKENNPFTSLARVIIASVRKRKLLPSSRSEDYYYHDDEDNGVIKSSPIIIMPSKKFRFLNHAARRTEGDVDPNGKIVRPWRLCTVQQVEDFKTLMKIVPLWSSSIFLGTPIGIVTNVSILQALTMDRHIGPHFQIPPGSMFVFALLSPAMVLPLIDRVLWPAWKQISGRLPTPLQRIGVGHVLNAACLVVAALVERERRGLAQSHANMSVFWLVPQLAIMGIGEAFHFPGQVALYYQEFPTSLKNLSTAMVVLLIAIAFYLSTAVIDLVQRATEWLPDDMNDGKLDYVYWMMAVIGAVNFGYYLICASFYNIRNLEREDRIPVTGLV